MKGKIVAKAISVFLILLGFVGSSVLLHEQRWYFWLLAAGEKTSGQLTDIRPAGEQYLTRSRYNPSSPSSVEAFDVSVKFRSAGVEYLATSRLDYYQLDELLDNQFTLNPDNYSALSGKPLTVMYLAHNPQRNRVDAVPTWSAYWSPLMIGWVFLGMGITLWRAIARR